MKKGMKYPEAVSNHAERREHHVRWNGWWETAPPIRNIPGIKLVETIDYRRTYGQLLHLLAFGLVP